MLALAHGPIAALLFVVLGQRGCIEPNPALPPPKTPPDRCPAGWVISCLQPTPSSGTPCRGPLDCPSGVCLDRPTWGTCGEGDAGPADVGPGRRIDFGVPEGI